MKIKPKSISSGPVIIEDGKVLLNREIHEEQEGNICGQFFLFPGGRMEMEDATPEETCIREVKEELGIDIEIIKPLRTLVIPSISEPEKRVVVVHFLAKRLTEVQPSEATIEWGWYDINDLPKNCGPNVYTIIEDIKRDL